MLGKDDGARYDVGVAVDVLRETVEYHINIGWSKLYTKTKRCDGCAFVCDGSDGG